MPPAETERAVVWRLGGALLAAPLDAVREVAPVTAEGLARTRTGEVEAVVPHGLDATPPRRAIILSVGDQVVAVAAEEVEGVADVPERAVAGPPGWLSKLDTRHVRAVVRLADDRLAALLEPEALLSG